MIINRAEFLNDLEMVSPGLSPREFIEQATCFVFHDGQVITYNDEISCRKPTRLNITGAIQASTLLDTLREMDGATLEVLENAQGEVEFCGKRKAFKVIKDAGIFLPIDKVEVPKQWHPLPKGLIPAISQVLPCVSTDESKFHLTCVHIHPEYVEACSNLQAMRVRLRTGAPKPMLGRGTSLSPVTQAGVNEWTFTKSWIHFRNNTTGIIISCRRYLEKYPALDKFLEGKGHPIHLPVELVKAIDRTAIFAKDETGDSPIQVTISGEKLLLEGKGLSGSYQERIEIKRYQGPATTFVIAAEIFKEIAQKHPQAEITRNKLKVTGERWEYVAALGKI